jgi:hypothetical protein
MAISNGCSRASSWVTGYAPITASSCRRGRVRCLAVQAAGRWRWKRCVIGVVAGSCIRIRSPQSAPDRTTTLYGNRAVRTSAGGRAAAQQPRPSQVATNYGYARPAETSSSAHRARRMRTDQAHRGRGHRPQDPREHFRYLLQGGPTRAARAADRAPGRRCRCRSAATRPTPIGWRGQRKALGAAEARTAPRAVDVGGPAAGRRRAGRTAWQPRRAVARVHAAVVGLLASGGGAPAPGWQFGAEGIRQPTPKRRYCPLSSPTVRDLAVRSC